MLLLYPFFWQLAGIEGGLSPPEKTYFHGSGPGSDPVRGVP
jgi:hypothetical protein